MKPDDEIEDMLRRLRPASPSNALRARILAPAQHGRWPWVAAAALLLTTLALQYSSANLRGALPRDHSGLAADAEAASVASLRELFDVSEEQARAMVLVQSLQARIAQRQEQEPR